MHNTNFLVPQYVFFTSGEAIHEKELMSFELALRKAGIEGFNLVPVSSILPANCQVISREEGLEMLENGSIVFCVMSRLSTNKDEVISTAVSAAIPRDKSTYGYIAESHGISVGKEEVENEAKNLAINMVESKGGVVEKTISIASSIKGKEGLYATSISCAVFIL